MRLCVPPGEMTKHIEKEMEEKKNSELLVDLIHLSLQPHTGSGLCDYESSIC